MIGLVDLDWCLSTSTNYLIPNLEIMKLASYYKSEENQFCRLLTLNEQELSNYDKIYVFSEITKNPIIPDNYLRANNVIYGGTAFTNGKYIPFENSIIDYTLPRTFIYKDFLKQKYNDGVRAKVIEHVLDDTYYRNYAGINRLPLPAVIPNKRVYLYDKDFFYNDWEKTIKIISERKPSSIIRIHPIICNTLTQYFSMRSYEKIARTNVIGLDLNIELEEVPYMLKKYTNLFLADIVAASNVYIPIGGSWPTQQQYFRDFIYKLNLLYCFWSKGIMIKLNFEPPNIGFNNPISNLEQLVASTFNFSTKNKLDYCINDKIPKKKNNIYIQEKNLLLKFHPSAQELFLQSFNKIQQRGRWTI